MNDIDQNWAAVALAVAFALLFAFVLCGWGEPDGAKRPRAKFALT